MKRSSAVAAILWLVSACGGGSDAPVDAAVTALDAEPPPDAGQADARLSTIHGTYVYTLYLAGGEQVTDAIDLSATQIRALVPEGTGDWRSYPATGQSDGTFEIAAVPEVTTYIQFGFPDGRPFVPAEYLVTGGREVDLGGESWGRLYAGWTSDATLVLTVDGLRPWQTGDSFMLFSENSRGLDWPLALPADEPADGTTALVDFALFLPFVADVDAAQGDRASLVQYTTSSTSAGDVAGPVRTGELSPFTLSYETTAEAAGALAEVPVTAEVWLAWDRPAFWELVSAIHPTAAPLSQAQMGIYAVPPGVPMIEWAGMRYIAPPVAYFEPTSDEGAVAAGMVSVRDPFPPAWPLAVYAWHGFIVTYQLPGAAAGQWYASVTCAVDLETYGTGPAAPLVGPVGAPRIDGRDAFAVLDGVGLTPTLSWSPPAVGTATAYRVSVWRVGVVDGITDRVGNEAVLFTMATEVTLPPETLEPGVDYVANITAIHTSVDSATHPRRWPLPYCQADALTSIFRP